MSGYESAPGTKLLATHCAVCARPLLDAKSVELGIGPECRRKYGFDVAVDPAARAEANRIVHDIAVAVSQNADRAAYGEEPRGYLGQLIHAVQRLEGLGFTKLGHKLIEGAATIKVELEGDNLLVSVPYDPTMLPVWHTELRARWDRDRKVRVLPAAKKDQLWAVLKRYYQGALGIGPKGVFVVNGGSL